MSRPSRARRILKWTGTVMTSVILAVWIASMGRDLCWEHSGDWLVGIANGNISAVRYEEWSGPEVIPYDTGSVGINLPDISYRVRLNSFHAYTSITLPFWLLLIGTAIPTAWLWHRDRRRIRPGCCLRCGYDLTGNTSGVCSECGLTAPPSADAKVV